MYKKDTQPWCIRSHFQLSFTKLNINLSPNHMTEKHCLSLQDLVLTDDKCRLKTIPWLVLECRRYCSTAAPWRLRRGKITSGLFSPISSFEEGATQAHIQYGSRWHHHVGNKPPFPPINIYGTRRNFPCPFFSDASNNKKVFKWQTRKFNFEWCMTSSLFSQEDDDAARHTKRRRQQQMVKNRPITKEISPSNS